MLAWRDVRGFAHFRTHGEDHEVPRTWRRRPVHRPNTAIMFRHFIPHIDLEKAYRAHHVQMPRAAPPTFR
jgi:hypothetical protein